MKVKITELEQRIKQAFDKEKPDISARLVAECDGVKQDVPTPHKAEPTTRRAIILPPVRRAIAAVICLVFFLGGLLVGRIPLANGTGDPTPTPTPTPVLADATVYLDVNPSVEIEIDSENRVVKCTAGNDDATLILEGLELDGVRLSTAVSAIVGSMYINGYLNDSANSILVSVDTPDGERTDALLGSLTDDINAVFANSALECSIIAQSVEVSDELREEARANGVSVGKMHLVDRMIDAITDLDGYDSGELSGLSINELNKIYSSHRDEFGGGDKHSGSAAGFIDEEDVAETVRAHLGISQNDVDKYKISFGYSDVDGERRLIYRVHISIIGDLKYRLIVDCENGEILESGLITDSQGGSHGSTDKGDDVHGDGTDAPPPTGGGIGQPSTDTNGDGEHSGTGDGQGGSGENEGGSGGDHGSGGWFDGGWFN